MSVRRYGQYITDHGPLYPYVGSSDLARDSWIVKDPALKEADVNIVHGQSNRYSASVLFQAHYINRMISYGSDQGRLS